MRMKYWKASLLREGRTAREWHVRADALTIGSHGSNLVRLPPPVAAFALRITEVAEPAIHEIEGFLLRIEDESAARESLWAKAQERLEHSASSASNAPLETPAPARIALAALTLMGITNFAGSLLVDGRPQALREFERIEANSFVERTGQVAVAAYRSSSDPGLENASPSDGPKVGHLLSYGATAVASAKGGAPGWDGVILAGGPDRLFPATDERFTSSPPERYQAPWPDSPVPPH